MITEDYVSFEVAKLLKGKGFEGNINAYYHIWDNGNRVCSVREFTHSEAPYLYIPAPTLQMATKWLREVHNLNVEVYRTACGYIGCIVGIPSGTDIKFLEDDGDDLPSGQYTKFENACEAAIKYSIENLINK